MLIKKELVLNEILGAASFKQLTLASFGSGILAFLAEHFGNDLITSLYFLFAGLVTIVLQILKARQQRLFAKEMHEINKQKVQMAMDFEEQKRQQDLRQDEEEHQKKMKQ